MQRATSHPSNGTFDVGSALVLAPHPDDETLGCGILIAHKQQLGLQVSVAVISDGREGWASAEERPGPDDVGTIRHGEWHRALDLLGVDTSARHELGHRDQSLSSVEDDVSASIAALIRSLSPQQVFTTSPDDLHDDHRALARATMRAVDRIGHEDPVRTPELFAYRVYPQAGLWTAATLERPAVPRTATAIPSALWRTFRTPTLKLVDEDAAATKAAAVGAFASQRSFLSTELRSMWSDSTELFARLEHQGPPTTGTPRS